MMPIMYDAPSRDTLAGVVIGEDVVKNNALPTYIEKELIELEPKISGELE